MNSIRRYFPNWMDMDEWDRVTVRFDTKEELLDIPFVKKWADMPDFFQYTVSTSRLSRLGAYLMAQFKDGYEWWVIGILETSVKGLAEHVIPEDYYSDWPRSDFKGKLSDFNEDGIRGSKAGKALRKELVNGLQSKPLQPWPSGRNRQIP